MRAQRRFGILWAATCLAATLVAAPARAEGPFANLAGRWVGEGRLGFSEGKMENITCRATYFVKDAGEALEQNIRCASAGAKVEIKSALAHAAGKLSGQWSELIYEKSGLLEGDITPKGFRIGVKGDGLDATMEVIVRNDLQAVEVHFNNSTLIGMTLILKRG